MIEINDTRRENLPLTDEQFKDIIEQVVNSIDKSKMELDKIQEDSYIFDVKDTDNFTDGFEIIAEVQKNEENQIGIAIRKMIIFDDDDEWLEAYARIKESKK